MTGSRSRDKGQRGELEWAKYQRENWNCPDACRGQQRKGSPDSPDVIGGIPGLHPEVKRTEKLAIHAAMEQAVSESGLDEVPYVAHRANKREWLLIIRADDAVAFATALLRQVNRGKGSTTRREVKGGEAGKATKVAG